MAKNDVFVCPHPKGGWQVKRAGSKRAYRRAPSQKLAIFIGRRLAKNQKTELIIQRGDNGRIREKDSHGRDSRRRKG